MRQFRTSNLIIGLTLFTLIVAWGLFAFEMQTQRRESIDQVVVEDQRLVQVLEAHLQRTIEMVTLILDHTEHYALNEVIGMPPLHSQGSQFLGNTVKDTSYIAGLAIVGANGIANQGIEIFEDGISKTMTKRFDASEREYFTVFKENPNREIFVGNPIKTRTSDRWVVPISRSIMDASGKFMGITIAIVRLETFGKIFESVRPSNSLLTVYLSNGKVFVKSPYNPDKKLEDEKKIGQKILESAARPFGTINETMTNVEKPALISYRFANNWPFIIVLETPINSILTNWRQGVKRQTLTGIIEMIVFGGLAFILIFQISRREQTESELRKRSSAIEQSPNAVFITDLQGTIEYVNTKFTDLTGFTPQESLGQNPRILKSPDTPEKLFKDRWRTIRRGHEWKREIKDQRKDGSHFWAYETIAPVKDEDGNITHYVTTHEDITERQAMQEHLVQASKMATLGEMATGIAHELNQPLNVIRMAINNVKSKLTKNDADPEYLVGKLDKMEKQVERASAITDHMRIFGRKSGTEPEVLDTMKTVNGALDMISEQLRLSTIDVSVEGPDTCRQIRGHQVQFEQVLLNLLSNARDALGDEVDGEKRISVIVKDKKEDIVISIEDNAGGIDTELLGRIFEPFYTTKEIGKGTGLGLSISYGIIKEMRGNIEAENTKEGARFVITLPACEEDEISANN